MRVRAWGRRNRRPSKNEKAPGPLWPKTNTSNKKEPNRRGSEPLRPRRAFDPLPSLRQGERARPPAGRPACEQVHGPLETCDAAKREKQHTKKRTNASTASRPRKRASEQSRENPKNARGPEWHPEETPEPKGRTAKTGEQDKAAGTERKKTTASAGGVWCPVRPELYLFKKKEKEERQNTRRRQPRA